MNHSTLDVHGDGTFLLYDHCNICKKLCYGGQTPHSSVPKSFEDILISKVEKPVMLHCLGCEHPSKYHALIKDDSGDARCSICGKLCSKAVFFPK